MKEVIYIFFFNLEINSKSSFSSFVFSCFIGSSENRQINKKQKLQKTKIMIIKTSTISLILPH
jgi:hypothetical protein